MDSIKAVITSLENIVEECIENKSAAGYFAAMYLHTTRAVKDAIDKKEFENCERMERLDVLFAIRYLDAYKNWKSKSATTQSWQRAFTAVETNKVSALQHMLCGMSAHINLDLGISAAETAGSDSIESMHKDFNHINDIIYKLIDKTQDKLKKVCWPIIFIDEFGVRLDEFLTILSIRHARNQAWNVAAEIARLPQNERENYINHVDQRAAHIGSRIVKPGVIPNMVLKPIRWCENKKIEAVIRILNS